MNYTLDQEGDEAKVKTARIILDGLIDGSYSPEMLTNDPFIQGALVGLAVGKIRMMGKGLLG